ncbi:MAG: bifunctional demethylmenaquinone methyltransferase/2-methoxy-6-polyprenyl-1,4-benzoquinol methylase UbiE [Bacteroidia bacterium]|nr:bifunctional demethylmenaquinone methyltransferase/2-methoxy-6-polyprenyl-1,4-benzoquinol methylase UbiE [Bacteroidia bacterium]NNK89864.1 bifunctional demethylmenaquinone methyltransferase/2-methoxy-6-polyprenyl-1,4-benzoquinol methylase UbiE [Saprospiraceae bacterium]
MEEKIVKPYKEESSKKVQVTNMFDKIAPKYDLLNRVLSLGIDRRWRSKAISRLNQEEHRKILDVATGTADMVLEINKQISPDEIIGLDISSEMINYGNKKIEKAGLKHLASLEVGDSEKMRFPDNYFDASTVAFGVRNFGNLEKGLSEMERILRPGGKIVILEFSRPLYFPFKQIFNIYFKYILPFIGKKTSKDKKAYNYLYESVQAFPDYEKFANILEKTGFRSVEWKPLSLGICTIYTGIKS